MKVTLISPYENITSYGIRCLSAALKKAGFQTQMIFLPRVTEGPRWEGFRYAYSKPVLDQLAELASDSGLIGITLMTNYFDNAVQITRHLRASVSGKIVWGGIHPTVRPEESLEYADIVCVGEGEDPLLELAQRLADGRGHEGIDNMWYQRDGQVVRTPLRPLPLNLDPYPYPDYDLSTQLVLHRGRIRPVTPELLLHYLRFPYDPDAPATYHTMMSRGCPFNCTYCCNNALRKVYGGRWRVRRRSVPNFVGELQQITTRFPDIRSIHIEDDVFISDVGLVRGFADAYKQAVDLPLIVSGFQPQMIKEDLIEALVDAGMDRVAVGIQTGSMRVMHQVYRRPVELEQMKHAFAVLHKFRERIKPPLYELIVDNPWETEADRLETLGMLLDIPKPYGLLLFSLTFYPGTALYDRARKEGILQDDLSQAYRKHFLASERTYINGLFRLLQSQRAPRWLMALLLHDYARRLNWVWLPYLVNRLFRVVQLLGAGSRSVLRRDWAAFPHALRRRHSRRTGRYEMAQGCQSPGTPTGHER